jgi:hypothetical protein
MTINDMLHCPTCDHALEEVFVNPAGEMIGCRSCAEKAGLAGENVSLEEWYASELVEEALSHYALTDPQGWGAGFQTPPVPVKDVRTVVDEARPLMYVPVLQIYDAILKPMIAVDGDPRVRQRVDQIRAYAESSAAPIESLNKMLSK